MSRRGAPCANRGGSYVVCQPAEEPPLTFICQGGMKSALCRTLSKIFCSWGLMKELSGREHRKQGDPSSLKVRSGHTFHLPDTSEPCPHFTRRRAAAIRGGSGGGAGRHGNRKVAGSPAAPSSSAGASPTPDAPTLTCSRRSGACRPVWPTPPPVCVCERVCMCV